MKKNTKINEFLLILIKKLLHFFINFLSTNVNFYENPFFQNKFLVEITEKSLKNVQK